MEMEQRGEQSISYNTAEDVDLPKEKRQKEFRVRHIDEQKTLTYEQVMILVNAAKNTPIYLQVMFAALMGLRRGEIIGLKYTDIDFVNRTLHVKRQLGIAPLSQKEECRAKTYTKQEIGLKTDDGIFYFYDGIIDKKALFLSERKKSLNENPLVSTIKKYILENI